MKVNVRSWRLVLLLVPLAIGLAWGEYFDGDAYVAFRCARDVAAGRGLTARLLRSPLYVLALWPLAELGIPLPQAGLVLSGLGWGAAAAAMYATGRALGRPVGAAVSAALAAFSPALVVALGSEVVWATALAWSSVAATVKGRWTAQVGAVALMLLARFDWITLSLAVLLLAAQWNERRRFPLRAALSWAVVVLGCWLLFVWHAGAPLPPLQSSLVEWGRIARRLLDESELYWLFLPLLLCGWLDLFATRRKTLWSGLLWAAMAILNGGAAGGAVIATLGLFLAGLGVDWVVAWAEKRNVARLDRLTLAVVIALVAGLPLGGAQVSSLAHRYQFRPVVRQELERQVGDWLCAHSDPTALVFASERVGYLADRPALTWGGDGGSRAALTGLPRFLIEQPPTYCVSFKGIVWDYVVRSDWFLDSYVAVQEFESPYEAASPFVVWRYRFGTAQPVGANFGNQISLLSLGTVDRASPGAEFDVVLHWEALQSPQDDYVVFVHLLDGDGQLIAGHDGPPVDGQFPTGAWLSGEIVSDVHRIALDREILAGTYRLQVGMYSWPSVERLPVWDSQGVEQMDRVLILRSIQVQ